MRRRSEDQRLDKDFRLGTRAAMTVFRMRGVTIRGWSKRVIDVTLSKLPEI
jgi:hypothetical protein